MKKIKFYSFSVTALLLIFLVPSVYSATFYDSFDDSVFTDNNWADYYTKISQTWSFSRLSASNFGYHASTMDTSGFPATKMANSGKEYYSAGLYMESLVRFNYVPGSYTSESIAGLAFGMTQDTGYLAAISLDFYDGDNKVLFGLATLAGSKLSGLDVTPVPITFDVFYRLVVQVDANQDISAYLYTLDGTLLGSVFATDLPSLDNGLVGIFGRSEVTFDDFTLIGNPVVQTGELSRTQVSELYVSIFGRASEGSGNAYWQAHSDMASAANTMLDTQAAKDYFGANLNTNQAFIEHIYLNTFNKTITDDFDGISYWVDILDAGTTRGEAVATLVGAINDYAPDGPYYNPDDTATVAAYNQFTNRVEVSNYMADNVYYPPNDWETSTSFSHGLFVTDDPGTMFTATVIINSFADELVLSDP